ncbi:MAG TPA: SatD family protein [Tessaracoccus flavescens]|uniref:SatD family protein n=1 Tax=Tessaracoccus flavescens TaxID=399497 RepID=A0A921EQX5_9ACTN|nr:SatD family protein [Tessaracoccus flavescens]
MKDSAVALLIDVVSSRSGDRAALHQALQDAAAVANERHPAVDPLRPTVGDELQGVYSTLGDALAASYTFRLALAPRWDARVGIGGGAVEVVDSDLGIQDGSAWWLAREAIDWVKEQAHRKGYESARTAIRDGRRADGASSSDSRVADALTRLIDAHVARLKPGVVESLKGVLSGEDNAAVADRLGISASANSQRVINNDLRVVADAIAALGHLR